MNPRIQELLTQSTYEIMGVKQVDQKQFAELIVRECAEITSGLSKLYPRTDVAFDVGYTMGTTRATKEIKQYFGVE